MEPIGLMKTYTEPSREIPVSAEVDVLVCGAGPGGIGAALGAARAGCRNVLLLEGGNAVGGVSTTGMMSHWTGSTESPLLEEICRLQSESVLLPPSETGKSDHYISHEALKNTYLKLLADAGVRVQLYTQVVDAIVEDGCVKGVVTESKSGREAILAKVVIDATGDGDVAARAGAAFDLGREGDHVCQPVTLMFRLGGVDTGRCIAPPSFETTVQVPKGEIQALAREHLPAPAGHTLLYHQHLPGEMCVNMTNVTDVDATDVRQLSAAELVCRRQMEEIVAFLREYAPGYEHCYAVAAAAQIGVRESRHFRTLHTLTEEDVVEARLFDDWIATRNHFNFDIHNTKGSGLDANGAQKHFHSKGKYSVPYRSCVPETLDGLLLAGRDIGGTHKAHSNYRVMPICLNVGQGVGIAAHLAASRGIQPRAVDARDIQAILKVQGVEP